MWFLKDMSNNLGTPLSKISDKYDVIIIGAGIGGLVCGCYLAKAGVKVLIVEKNNKVGGCCTSFKRDGFTFNAGAHAVGGYRKEGSVHKIISDLGLCKDLKMERAELTDTAEIPSCKIEIWDDIDRTIEGIKTSFPDESKNIQNFCNMIQNENIISLYLKYKNKTFQHILNSYFRNTKLKSGISIFLGNLGLPANAISAVTAITLFKEFVFDGGYYVIGGMQLFVNMLASHFVKNGGHFIFLKEVKKIKVNNKIAKGVVLDKGELIKSKYIISASDSISTFFNLINEKYLNNNFKSLIKNLKPSISAFIIYIGVGKNLRSNFRKMSYSLWYSKEDDINKIYTNWSRGTIGRLDNFVLCSCPSFYDRTLAPNDGEALTLISGAPTKDKMFWDENKALFVERLIRVAEEALGKFSTDIKVLTVATPATIRKFTSNINGAIYGWASTSGQNSQYGAYLKHGIKNLLTVGHWSLTPYGQGGINMAAHIGYSIAKSILRKKKTNTENKLIKVSSHI